MIRTDANIFDIAEIARDEFKMYAKCEGGKDLLWKDGFGGVNALIAQRAYNERKNLYLGISSKDSAQSAVLPVLFTAVCRLLLESVPDFMPPFDKIKDRCVFIAKEKVWRYNFIDGRHAMVSKIKGGTRTHFFKEPQDLLCSYFVSDANIDPQRRYCRTLEYFQDFYSRLRGSNSHAPSFFPLKIIVICNKTELINQLRAYNLIHCFPLAGITSKHEEYINETLPIDPLVLLASSYETVREYILNQKDQFHVRYLIANGENKVGRIRSQIKNDFANGLFSRYCLIGCQTIPTDNNMVLWHWGRKEQMRLKDTHEIELVMETLKNCVALSESVESFYKCLSDMYEDYGSDEYFSEIKLGLYRILSDKLNEIREYDHDLGNAIRDRIVKILLSENYAEEEIQEDIERITDILRAVFQAKLECPDYLEELVRLNKKYLPLVVRNSQLETWKEIAQRRFGEQLKIITYKDLVKELKRPSPGREYVLTFLPTLQQMVNLVNMMISNQVSLRVVLYPPEISIMRSKLRMIRNWNRVNEGPKDPTVFPNLNFTPVIREASEDLIERIEARHSDEIIDLAGNSEYETVTYSILVTNQEGSQVVISSPNKLLRLFDQEFELVPITELVNGDTILVYENKSRESLYSILREESDMFAKAHSDSMLWKRRLWEYASTSAECAEDNVDNGERVVDPVRLLQLSHELETSPDYIYNHWVKQGSRVYFPQKKMLERVMIFLREKNLLSPEEKEQIWNSRNFFVGVMISLGQNLSSEAQRILLSKEQNLADYIERNVVGNANRYPLLSRFDAEAVTGILIHNFCQYAFVAIKAQEESNDGE